MPDEIGYSPPTATVDVDDKDTILKNDKADEGYEIFEQGDLQAVTPEQSAALRKKLDMRLLPIMCIMYGICYIDKFCMSWAVLFEFREDLDLQGKQYSWGSSIFYFGFLVAQYPGNYMLQKLQVSKVLGWSVITWGVLMIGYVPLSYRKPSRVANQLGK